VEALLEHPYFAAEPPKSTGRELFTPAYVERFVAMCKSAAPGCSSEDVVATAVSLTARSIALAFARFVPEPVAEVVLSGGGAKNPALFDAIERELARVAASGTFQARRVVTFGDLYFDGEAKEAVAFAFLGWLHLMGRPGNVPTATGARGPRILGTFTPA
jgi:anhydro-N-acetylmuramic acid kinase